MEILISALPSIVGVAIEAIILVACFSYLSRAKTTDSKLLFIGSSVGLLVQVSYIVLRYLLMYPASDEVRQSITLYFSIAGFFGLAGSILFCIGFVQLLKGAVQKHTSGFGTLDS
jgi:hypothetical protein